MRLKLRGWNRYALRCHFMSITKKTKIWILMSVLWVFLWGILAIELLASQAGLPLSRLVLLLIGPLIISWGIWWVRRE